MKKLILAAAALLIVPQAVSAQAGAQPVDYVFLTECAAVYSIKAEETMGKLPSDYTDNYYLVAASFYEKAVGGGGNEMKGIYKQKLDEFKNASDTVTKQYKRAVEKQCTAAAPDHGIKIKR